ncbi:MAG: hypothetical protein ACI86H_000666 [bacterium]|jgi:hypothetical protein
MKRWISLFLLVFFLSSSVPIYASGGSTQKGESKLPIKLSSYKDSKMSVGEKLVNRVKSNPFNFVATLIFLCAIIHTFLASKIEALAHKVSARHKRKIENLKKKGKLPQDTESVSFFGEILHFLGEIEAIFGIWTLPLIGSVIFFYDWHTVESYIGHEVNYIEPIFVVVIMTLAATKPVIYAAEKIMERIAMLGKGSPAAWWLTLLTIGPILGSFITEPGAMTITALLLAHQIYDKQPKPVFAYATLGLLFVNISVGGTLSHFAAPPVLMVAETWKWDFSFMFFNFGWKAVLGILIANTLYFLAFRKELVRLAQFKATTVKKQQNHIPLWIILTHFAFMFWTVFNAHTPVLFVGGFLFFLGFAKATAPHQDPVNLKPALLVGFFLAGLVTHGGLQAWWIEPILGSLSEVPSMLGATILTSFNDNAAITYLSTLYLDPEVGMQATLKYAVVAGAVTGGGLTVIANAPNPAGQSILNKYFKGGIAPLGLLASAIIPTIIMGLCFMLL